MSKQENPYYLERLRERYIPSADGKSKETNATRGNFSMQALEEIVFPRFSNSSLNILIVGLGLSASGGIEAQYEPYMIAALNEARNRDYSFTLIDVDQSTIDAFLKRRKIFHEYTSPESDPNFNDNDLRHLEAWQLYLQLTCQKKRIIFDSDEELTPNDYFQTQPAWWAEIVNDGHYVADLPQGLEKKLNENSFATLTSDIAVANLQPYQPFHLVSLQNVLIYLPSYGQQLALENISRSMKKGGIIVVDDYDVIMPWWHSLFRKPNHGWITEDMLPDFSLKIADRKHEGDNHTIYFLEKT